MSSEKRHSPDAARHVSNAAGKLIIDDAWDEKASREFQTPPIGELWRLAIDKLAESTRQMLLVGDSEHVPLQQQIEELIGMAKMMEKKCDEKSWKFTIGGRKIILRDYAAILVSYLRSVDNIAILVAQTQASVAWSAVKFIMQVRFPRPSPMGLQALNRVPDSREQCGRDVCGARKHQYDRLDPQSRSDLRIGLRM